ncbi:type II toxin-antitoxin system RelE/ParE family toxin [Chelativorans sp. AA-79]|uniref:type II toxin-antitoxin system RelE family toxin n=1 Tax=Chelativorans sp. AA-79 TaxID=3028735 RepID=UPI0023F6D207|nr:type II toxin-antitoxin system RelE/ParE family toxin [Chelativorans sp. AA-79]WEX07566.1 type II toxin-antitoxin system RelE/ParE family toxin [Chelativorans sp. AA-79]
MTWTIEVDDAALRQLKKIGRVESKRIYGFLRERIATLDNPRKLGAALQGSRFEHLWRYRVGDYRIICDIQDHKLVVLVLQIGHRREIYR